MSILLELLLVACVALVAARLTRPPLRGRVFAALKLWLTVRMVWLLSVWPVTLASGETLPAWKLVMDTARRIDPGIFWTFLALAVGVKAIGILSSMLRWLLLLRGLGIDFPFRHIFGTFLIGRAIGFFLPSTVGLDAYMLYDAARFSGRTVEVTAGKFLEKVIGFSGIFISFLVALPFGIGIFGEHGTTVALVTLPIASGVIAALMMLLWFPGVVQWLLENVPIPARGRLEALLMRASRASAAYRDKKGLVVLLFVLSFLVHFTTAAMYFFTAIAVGAGASAEFWPIAFGSSIQIFATVIGPTIGGIGIREAVQYATLGGMLGAGAAILSASLGFLAAEAPTVLGFLFWIVRTGEYRPGYCRVDGVQVDYEEAARAAVALEGPQHHRADRPTPHGPVPAFSERLRRATAAGFAGGVLGGMLLGGVEAGVIGALGFGADAQVLWYGPLVHALLFGALGALGGMVLAALPMERGEIRGWTASLALLATLVPLALAITVFRLRRDVYLEQMPPIPVLLAVLGAFGVLALVIFLAGPRLLHGRAGRLFGPGPALGLLALAVAGGAVASRLVLPGPGAPAPAPAVPSALADRPNVVLVMVDTLRADHLSCYDPQGVPTPNLCSLAEDGGTRFEAFSHASWTKPAAASLLTSTLPSTHGAVSKPAALSPDTELVAETLQRHGYATGAVVSNINLAASFGFDQGWDEYHYLGPDYLAGAGESSSKLILYQIARSVWFKLKPGMRFGDFYQDSRVVNELAFDWLERHADSRFFLFLHYMDPHDPYFAHPYDGRGVARVSTPHPEPERARELQELYRGEIAYLDHNFGALLERLRELGLYDNTVIALTSDHGEEFQEHGGWWHGLTLYDEQIHVPLLVKWPRGRRAAPADARAHLVRLIDVAPTLVARTGAPIPASMQGMDLASDLAARAEPDKMLLAEEDHEGNVLRALRTKSWKLIEANPGNPRGLPTEELFDVSADPRERRNLLGEDTSTAQIAAELREHLEAQAAFARSRADAGGTTAEISRDECEKLRMLGYVQECN